MQQSKTTKIRVRGTRTSGFLPKSISEKVQLVDELSTNAKRDSSQEEILQFGANDILAIEFGDEQEWITRPSECEEIFAVSNQRSGQSSNEIALPARIQSSTHRGLSKKLTWIRRYRVTGANWVASKIAAEFDRKRCPAEGVFGVTAQGTLSGQQPKGQPGTEFLLLIHGTSSNHQGSFGDLFRENVELAWKPISKKYGTNVLTAQHYTLTKGPIENALDILKELPPDSTIDILSHSRGGIVADFLTRADTRDLQGFTPEERIAVGQESADLSNVLTEFVQVAQEKRITFRRQVRVACPARGTELLGRKVEHFLNGMLWAIGQSIGDRLNPFYQEFKAFVIQILRAKDDPEVLPGLNCMVEDSLIQRLLNNPQVSVPCELFSVEGNAEFGGSFLQSIGVILTNLFYWKANDFVVNTDSMRHGVSRMDTIRVAALKDAKTNHFSYFRHLGSQKAMSEALTWDGQRRLDSFSDVSDPTSVPRGMVTKMLGLGALEGKDAKGKRNIALVLPGNMASHLKDDKEHVWVTLDSLLTGSWTEFDGSQKLNAKSVVRRFYAPLVQQLERDNYDVVIHPYDWRISLDESAKELALRIDKLLLHNVPIKIVAHSMGGLLLRGVMINHLQTWKSFITKADSRVLLLGVPWRGSYAAVHALIGRGSLVRKLNRMSILKPPRSIAGAIHSFEGSHQLLPIDENPVQTITYWRRFKNLRGKPTILPSKGMLSKFTKYKKRVLGLTLIETDKIFYIAGVGVKPTTDHADLESTLWGDRLKEPDCLAGDDTVSWRLGIPEELQTCDHVYYTNATHMNLCADAPTVRGVSRLLQGDTLAFSKTPPVRAQSRGSVRSPISFHAGRESMLIDDLFDIYEQPSIVEEAQTLNVRVIHGDLRYATAPVMLGHFRHDGIVSAEGALDRALGYKLTDHLSLGGYPQSIGQSLVIYDENGHPPGGVVVGLGFNSDLTESLLSRTVAQGAIKYALHLRDNGYTSKEGERLSCIFIGSAYGGLKLDSSIRAIISGIERANRKLRAVEDDLVVIKCIDFIDIFKHIAQQAMHTLQVLAIQESKLNLIVDPVIYSNIGALERAPYQTHVQWWHQFTTRITEHEEDCEGMDEATGDSYKLHFLSSSGISRVEEEGLFGSKRLIESFLVAMAETDAWNGRHAKTIFELLIPNNFKDIIRSERNILWRMDAEAAQYPWEMFHDFEIDEEPTFTRAGLIRQLVGSESTDYATVIRSKTALVIADPHYTELPQLPNALLEGQKVNKYLRSSGFDPKYLERPGYMQILEHLMNEKFKILHIAGHGIYDPCGLGIGIVADDFVITSAHIRQMPTIPEFVFINCCHLGRIDKKFEKYYYDRNKMAANIGTELIRMGVHAAVITGWAVDDSAAEVFAEELYTQLLSGTHFGIAVRLARKKCYEYNRDSTTWAAYQCYGNQWYKLDRRAGYTATSDRYYTLEEALIDLNNLGTDIQCGDITDLQWLEAKLDQIEAKLERSDMGANPRTLEKIAALETALGRIEQPLHKYRQLLTHEDADFTVSSLEAYCILRARDLYHRYSGDTTKSIQKEIDSVITDFERLMAIGSTSCRLSSYAGALKKLSTLAADQRAEKYLNKSMNSYRRAYEILQHREFTEYSYPWCNWKILQMLVEVYGVTDRSRKRKATRLKAQILAETKEIKNQLATMQSSFSSFYNEAIHINIQTVELLASPAQQQVAIGRVIKKEYEELWKKAGTYHHLKSELEHFSFIEYLLSSKVGDSSQALKAIRIVLGSLENLLG